jgi:hypothetical protein
VNCNSRRGRSRARAHHGGVALMLSGLGAVGLLVRRRVA